MSQHKLPLPILPSLFATISSMSYFPFAKDIVHQALPQTPHRAALVLNLLGTRICHFAGGICDMLRQVEVVDICSMIVHDIAHGAWIVNVRSVGADGGDLGANDRLHHGLMVVGQVTFRVIVGENRNAHDRDRLGSIEGLLGKVGEVDR